MIIVMVQVRVKPEAVQAFQSATRDNAEHSVQERGIARFDVAQDAEDPTRFVLVEAYRSEEAVLAHKRTAHYERWRDAVAGMMAEPRSSRKYGNVFPGDEGW